MESLDYWRLCDELSIIYAALLIVGEDPSGNNSYIEDWHESNQPTGYQAAKTALTNAISSGVLPATIRRNLAKPHLEDSVTSKFMGNNAALQHSIDISLTTIKVNDLKTWLITRGFKTGFFFPQTEIDKPDYLDINHPNYSQKLGAAIESWLAITENPELLKAKTVKKALTIYLRIHAFRFGLIKDDGNPNEQGIEEIAKIANWETKGGAPKTPSEI